MNSVFFKDAPPFRRRIPRFDLGLHTLLTQERVY
jgi:hypothetical protein